MQNFKTARTSWCHIQCTGDA